MDKTKIVLIGDSGVGKTAIAIRLVSNTFDTNLNPTIGAACLEKNYNINGVDRLFQIWDTAGEEKFRSIMPLYLQGASGAFLVFDVTNKESTRFLKQWKEIITAEGDMPIILLGNKTDCDSRNVSHEDAIILADELQLFYIETSALNGMGIEEAFASLVDVIVESENGKVIPAHYESKELVHLEDTVIPDSDRGCRC